METERVNSIVEIIKEQLYTGHIGDGKIFIYKLDNVIRVRTGDEGEKRCRGWGLFMEEKKLGLKVLFLFL